MEGLAVPGGLPGGEALILGHDSLVVTMRQLSVVLLGSLVPHFCLRIIPMHIPISANCRTDVPCLRLKQRVGQETRKARNTCYR